MTPTEIRRKNLIKMGFTCKKCGLVYDDGHPMDGPNSFWIKGPEEIKDKCNNDIKSPTYYTFRGRRIARNYNLFKVRGEWYRVRSPLVDMFLGLTEIEEAVMGHISYPAPTDISRQVDIYTVSEKLGVPPPMNEYQQKRAKSKSFIERIKG